MNNVLERIVDVTREEVRRRRKEVPMADLEARIHHAHDGRPFSEALVRPGVSVIAEHKHVTLREPVAASDRQYAVRQVHCNVNSAKRATEHLCMYATLANASGHAVTHVPTHTTLLSPIFRDNNIRCRGSARVERAENATRCMHVCATVRVYVYGCD